MVQNNARVSIVAVTSKPSNSNTQIRPAHSDFAFFFLHAQQQHIFSSYNHSSYCHYSFIMPIKIAVLIYFHWQQSRYLEQMLKCNHTPRGERTAYLFTGSGWYCPIVFHQDSSNHIIIKVRTGTVPHLVLTELHFIYLQYIYI